FAAELLAPRQGVTAWVEERDLFKHAADPDTAIQLALEFGIAFPTAAFRLERSGVIGPAAKKRLVDELSRRGRGLAQIHGAHRLFDTIESLWWADEYPRMPRRTVSYAERARAAGLLEEGDYRAIVAEPPELDFADCMA